MYHNRRNVHIQEPSFSLTRSIHKKTLSQNNTKKVTHFSRGVFEYLDIVDAKLQTRRCSRFHPLSSLTSYFCLLSFSQWSYFTASRLCSHSHSSFALSLTDTNQEPNILLNNVLKQQKITFCRRSEKSSYFNCGFS